MVGSTRKFIHMYRTDVEYWKNLALEMDEEQNSYTIGLENIIKKFMINLKSIKEVNNEEIVYFR